MIDALGEYLTAAVSRAWRPSELVASLSSPADPALPAAAGRPASTCARRQGRRRGVASVAGGDCNRAGAG